MEKSIICKKWKNTRSVPTETEKGWCDHISQVPNHVLALILSLLPLKKAVKTCILSRRWRYVWNLMPNLNLKDYCAFKSNEEGNFLLELTGPDPRRWVRIIHHMLFFRQDPIQSCEISSRYLTECSVDIDQFILFLTKLSIQELIIDNTGNIDYPVSYDLFDCQSLTTLKLFYCDVNLPSSFRGLSRLKTLELRGCVVTDDVIYKLISSCPLLERLKLGTCLRLEAVKIHAPNLLDLCIYSGDPISICLENAGRLLNVSLRLFFTLDMLQTDVVSMDMVKTDVASMLVLLLRSLTQVETLSLDWYHSFSKCLCRGNILESLPDMYLNLRKLVMPVNLMSAKEVDLLACLLRKSSYLLDIVLRTCEHQVRTVTRQDYWEKQKAFDCLTNHLRTVRLSSINVQKEHGLGFLKFLVMNAYVLERITCVCWGCTVAESKNIEEELLSVRASSHLRLLITCHQK